MYKVKRIKDGHAVVLKKNERVVEVFRGHKTYKRAQEYSKALKEKAANQEQK